MCILSNFLIGSICAIINNLLLISSSILDDDDENTFLI